MVRIARKKTQLVGYMLAALVVAGLVYLFFFSSAFATYYARIADLPPKPPVLDTGAYNLKMLALTHIFPATSTPTVVGTTTATTTKPTLFSLATSTATMSVSVPGKLWPTPAVYPQAGALLPFNRIVAYYGNFYSKNMGVLGQYPVDEMLAMLASTTAKWQIADPSTPVIPAIDYIAVTAQGSPGFDGKYRARMPESEINKAIGLANQIHGVTILDVQVGLSNLRTELPLLEPYLKLPNVELAIDPEFAMHNGEKPGSVIGTFDATDVNYAAEFLASVVDQNNLPPKILVVHRFTQDMVTHAKNIQPLPEVQVVMDMDGWGTPQKKIGTYTYIVYPEPVQFTGFKLFYKNDLLPPSTGMLTPAQVLSLTPAPVFIQYQ